MEPLLDKADALVFADDRPERPDFEIPEGLDPQNEFLETKESLEKGKGWFARRDIPTGTVLMVAKPLGMVMDWQEDEIEEMEESDAEDKEEEESKLSQLLVIQLLTDIQKNPSLWTDYLTDLYPRTNADLEALPAWVCPDDSVFLQIEALIQQLGNLPQLQKDGIFRDISKRLPLIVRYNVLSVETCPELLSHPGPTGHSALSGVGVYHLPSFFNHDSRPNVSRWAIGDVMWFVANQNIAAGQEALISYLEHDVLCESGARRNLLLTMDFDDGDGQYPEDDGPDAPVVDSDVQNELMAMDPFERLTAIEELLQQALGERRPEAGDVPDGEDAMDVGAGGPGWFQADIQNLRILKAITLDGLGQGKAALVLWEQCVEFTETKLPPLDESSVVMRVQAALCAHHVGELDRAREHAAVALRTHSLLFGDGVTWFRRRYAREMRLSLRPEPETQKDDAAPFDILWPCL